MINYDDYIYAGRWSVNCFLPFEKICQSKHIHIIVVVEMAPPAEQDEYLFNF